MNSCEELKGTIKIKRPKASCNVPDKKLNRLVNKTLEYKILMEGKSVHRAFVKIFIGAIIILELYNLITENNKGSSFVVEAGKSKSSKSKTTVIAIDGGSSAKMHPIPVPWPVVHCHHHHHHMKYIPKPLLVHHWVKKHQPFEMSDSMNHEKMEFQMQDKVSSSDSGSPIISEIPNMPSDNLDLNSPFPLSPKVRSQLELEVKKRRHGPELESQIDKFEGHGQQPGSTQQSNMVGFSDSNENIAASIESPQGIKITDTNDLSGSDGLKSSLYSLEGNKTYMIDHSSDSSNNNHPKNFQTMLDAGTTSSNVEPSVTSSKPNFPFDAPYDQIIDETRPGQSKFLSDITFANHVETNKATKVAENVSKDRALRIQAVNTFNNMFPFGPPIKPIQHLISNPANMRHLSNPRLQRESSAIDFMTKWAAHMAQSETKKLMNNYQKLVTARQKFVKKSTNQTRQAGKSIFTFLNLPKEKRRISKLSNQEPTKTLKRHSQSYQNHLSNSNEPKDINKDSTVDQKYKKANSILRSKNALGNRLSLPNDQLMTLSSSSRGTVQTVDPVQSNSNFRVGIKTRSSFKPRVASNTSLAPSVINEMNTTSHSKEIQAQPTTISSLVEQFESSTKNPLSSSSTTENLNMIQDQSLNKLDPSYQAEPSELDQTNSIEYEQNPKTEEYQIQHDPHGPRTTTYPSGPASAEPLVWPDQQQQQDNEKLRVENKLNSASHPSKVWPAYEMSTGTSPGPLGMTSNEIESNDGIITPTQMDNQGYIEFPLSPQQWSVEAVRSVNGEDFVKHGMLESNSSNPIESVTNMNNFVDQTISSPNDMITVQPSLFQNHMETMVGGAPVGPVELMPSSGTLNYQNYPYNPLQMTSYGQSYRTAGPMASVMNDVPLQTQSNEWFGRANPTQSFGASVPSEMNQLRQFQSNVGQSLSQANNTAALINLTAQLRDQVNNLQSRLPSMPNIPQIPQPPQAPNIPMPPPGLMQMAGLALPFAMARATRQNNRFRNNQVNSAVQGGGTNVQPTRPGQRFLVRAATFTNRILSQRRPRPTSRPMSFTPTKNVNSHRRRRFGPGIIRTVIDLSRRPTPGNNSKNSKIIRPKIDRDSASLLAEPKIDRSMRSILWNPKFPHFGSIKDDNINIADRNNHVRIRPIPLRQPTSIDVDGNMISFTSMNSPVENNIFRKKLDRNQVTQSDDIYNFVKHRINGQRQSFGGPQVKGIGYGQQTIQQWKTPSIGPLRSDQNVISNSIEPFIGDRQQIQHFKTPTTSSVSAGPLVANHINLLLFAAQNVTGPVVREPQNMLEKYSESQNIIREVSATTAKPEPEFASPQDIELMRQQSISQEETNQFETSGPEYNGQHDQSIGSQVDQSSLAQVNNKPNSNAQSQIPQSPVPSIQIESSTTPMPEGASGKTAEPQISHDQAQKVRRMVIGTRKQLIAEENIPNKSLVKVGQTKGYITGKIKLTSDSLI